MRWWQTQPPWGKVQPWRGWKMTLACVVFLVWTLAFWWGVWKLIWWACCN